MIFFLFLALFFTPVFSTAETAGELIDFLGPQYKDEYRQRAKDKLAGMGSRALPELYSAYREASDGATKTAILGVMGEIGDGSVSSWIISRLNPRDSVVLHGKMIETLGRLKSKSAVEPLTANIRKVQKEVFFPQDQETILSVTFWALGEIGDVRAKAILEAAVRHFKTGNPMLYAINAIGKFKGERPGDFIRGLLLYEEPSVRFAAAHCIEARGEAVSVPALWTAFESEKNPEVAQALAQAIASLDRAGAASRFSDMFYSGSDEWKKNSALLGLKTVGQAGVPYALKGMQTADWKVKIEVIKLLGEIGGGSGQSSCGHGPGRRPRDSDSGAGRHGRLARPSGKKIPGIGAAVRR